jgi:hypothetical protein
MSHHRDINVPDYSLWGRGSENMLSISLVFLICRNLSILKFILLKGFGGRI